MKKSYSLLFVTLCLALCLLGPVKVRADERNLYSITADAYAGASVSLLLIEMESRFDVYNTLFRFDPSLLPSPLKVRVFGNKEAYDQYVTEHLGFTRAGAVYLHYSQAERRELVIHREATLLTEAPMLAHQAFIQYLRAFIPNPPSWMLEGFAIYFSTLNFDPPLALLYEENLLWLESVKKLGNRLPSPEALFLADISGFPSGIPSGYSPEARTGPSAEIPEDFQISSWALVSFLLNSGLDYFRTLTESFMLLSPTADAAENSLVVMNRFSRWNGFNIDVDFKSYLESRRTYRELMDDGLGAYSIGDMMNAEFSFMAAKEQHPAEFAPYYYLGLLSYEGKDYETAEQYYLASLERGADEALISYALGINAAAAGRFREAAGFLEKAATLDPARYLIRANDLIRKMGQQ